MSVTLQAVQFSCDWCGKKSPQVPLAASGAVVDTPLPAGWTGIGWGSLSYRAVDLTDAWGTQISHLCDVCAQRPAGDLLSFVGRTPDLKVTS